MVRSLDDRHERSLSEQHEHVGREVGGRVAARIDQLQSHVQATSEELASSRAEVHDELASIGGSGGICG